MKKIFLLFTLTLLFSVQIFGQGSLKVLYADTISNSATASQVLDLWNIGYVDSITFGVVATGEIDLDSLTFMGGTYFNKLSIKGTEANYTFYEALSGGATALSIDNADGVTTIVQNVVSLTHNELMGYNRIRATIRAGAAGNDSGDASQKFIVVYQVHRPVQFKE